ncbi:ATP synthase F0 subunit C [Candidatus Dependentiae bacterium]|jgi:F-type H+-transporting ATPase subunit c|nr:ATP synthase F0 subunit C [Candidatus Dependentiae bacterium]
MAASEAVKIAAYIAAGICMGIGTLGPSLGQGYIGGQACESIGKKPEAEGSLMKIMFIALAFVESTSIYAFFISLLLVLYVGQ